MPQNPITQFIISVITFIILTIICLEAFKVYDQYARMAKRNSKQIERVLRGKRRNDDVE